MRTLSSGPIKSPATDSRMRPTLQRRSRNDLSTLYREALSNARYGVARVCICHAVARTAAGAAAAAHIGARRATTTTFSVLTPARHHPELRVLAAVRPAQCEYRPQNGPHSIRRAVDRHPREAQWRSAQDLAFSCQLVFQRPCGARPLIALSHPSMHDAQLQPARRDSNRYQDVSYH